MALNPLLIPQQQQQQLHHSRTASASSSASSTHHLYDQYIQQSFPLGRPPQGVPLHGRTSSASSAAFSLATHITSPADSPPNLANHPQAAPSAYKSLSVARNQHHRRRNGSSPYSRGGGDDYHSSSSISSRSGSTCSDAEQDDLAMYFNHQQPHQQQQQHHHQFPPQQLLHSDYTGLFVHANQNYLGLPHNISPLDTNTVGAFGSMSLDPEQALEQLAANVRASTTTTASDRAKQVFVHAWLSSNYAPFPDGNVPRQGLYNSYRRVCDQYNIPHINTATLGKAIRLCFPSIKTRRLGVRGNSKYHYCGIHPTSAAEAEFLRDFVRRTTNHSAIAAGSRRGAQAAAAAAGGNGSDEEEDDDSENSSGLDGPSREPQFTFNNGPHHLNLNGPGGSSISNLGSSGLPHPLVLGGMKSPTLFMMTDDKTPTTNGVLAAAQAQAGMNMGLSYGASQAQIRRKPGFGSAESNVSAPGGGPSSRPGTSGSGALPSSSTGGFLDQPPIIGPPMPSPVSVRNLPNFPSINEALGIDSSFSASSIDKSSSPSGSPSSATEDAASPANAIKKETSPQHMAALEVWKWFEDHLDGLLESVRGWRFDQFEIHLRTFWASLSGDYREVVHAPAVAGLMVKADAIVYDEILEIMKSQLLTPIPPQVLTSLRQLAGKMEKILLLALENYGNTFVEPKVELGARFGHLVLRFLDMFQVTQALSSVLTNHKQLIDMRRAWGEIDFESIRNQAALVCNCRHGDLLQLLEVDFVRLLDTLLGMTSGGAGSGGDPVKEVMDWADGAIERLMNGGAGNAGAEERASMGLRSVLIRWGYVTSQIMRDLTIRSDPAFGAFQILKLFCDDWIALQVLRSVALSTNSIQASVEIPQQYLSLSPMPGQEFTGDAASSSALRDPTSSSMGTHSHMMDHTPTTSSMLAALHDSFGPGSTASGLGPSGLSNSYTPSYSSLSYGSVDTPSAAGGRDEGLLGVHQHHQHHHNQHHGMSFADFQAPSQFDITSFLASESGGATGVEAAAVGGAGTPGSDTNPIEGSGPDVDVKDEIGSS